IFFMIFSVGFLIFFSGKKYITTPRLGIVKFKAKRNAEKKMITLIFLIFFIITLIIYTFTVTNLLDFEEYFLPIVFGLFFTAPISLLAYIFRLYRLYIYAVMGGICFFISEFSYLKANNPNIGFVSFIVVGTGVISVGVVLFIRFMRKYPKSKVVMLLI
ncbi:MAG: hypothetical protein ACFE85_17390, partial [Candidatus Hodarchaeota archaeon]